MPQLQTIRLWVRGGMHTKQQIPALILQNNYAIPTPKATNPPRQSLGFKAVLL